MREYMEKLDEIVRGAFVDPDTGTAVRPETPGQRTTLARGLQKARSYNRAMHDFVKGSDSPDQAELDKLKGKRSGAASGTIIQKDMTGKEKEVGAPVELPDAGTWQAMPVTPKDKLRWGMDRSPRADDGKRGAVKKPQLPF